MLSPLKVVIRNTRVIPLMLGLGLSSCGGLPKADNKAPSTAIKNTGRTPLAAVTRPHLAAHPGQSGFHALDGGREALAARLALVDAAQSSIDAQYFIWNQDMAGKVLLERILRAADRGVRVRLLLDDLGVMPTDPVLLAIDSHPHVEVRMFNPAAVRSPRWLGLLIDPVRINRRMHNKSLTADGQVAIVGGRNIGDEYFDASQDMNFVDLDLAVIGPVVGETSDDFDLYWNNRSSIPITSLSREKDSPGQLATMRQSLAAGETKAEQTAYADAVRDSEFVGHLRNRNIPWHWGQARIVSDHPDKVATPASRSETHLAPMLREVVQSTKSELFLVSPYFIPGKDGVTLLADTHRRGARVVVITNSLASTDADAVNAKYATYRKSLLRAGVELYETKPTAGARDRSQRSGSSGGSSSSGSSGLHAKTFTFDRQTGFVGSYNLDPRSNRLNTEMGVLFDCPELVRRLPEELEKDLARNAYRVELAGRRVIWRTQEGGKEVRYDSEPGASFGKRFKTGLLRWLPIEGLL